MTSFRYAAEPRFVAEPDRDVERRFSGRSLVYADADWVQLMAGGAEVRAGELNNRLALMRADSAARDLEDALLGFGQRSDRALASRRAAWSGRPQCNPEVVRTLARDEVRAPGPAAT